jgi:hypothetical protein
VVHLSEIPRYTAAIPFIGTALLLVVGQVVGRYVGARLESDIAGFFGESVQSGAIGSPIVHEELDPAMLRLRFEWGYDSIQAAVAIVAPVFGFALLPIDFRGNFALILLFVVGATLVLLFVTLRTEPGIYTRRTLFREKAWALTQVTWVGVTLNLACGVLAAFLSAPTFVSTTQ